MDLEPFFLLSRQFLEVKNQRYVREVSWQTLFGHRLSLLLGSRGVGKTTLLIQYCRQWVDDNTLSRKVLYIPLDHLAVQEAALYEVAECFVAYGGELLVVDEVHRYRDWSKALKSIYDTFPKLKVIASGSSALEIYRGSHDLTRRTVVHTINGLSFREFLALKYHLHLSCYPLANILGQHEMLTQAIVKAIDKADLKVLSTFQEYLQNGYFPYFLEMPSASHYQMTLVQNLQTTLEADIPAIYPELTGIATHKMKQLLHYIAGSIPFTTNLEKLKQLAHIGDSRTLKQYLKYLEDAGLIRLLLRQSDKLKGLEAPKKMYLHNPNQYFALTKTEVNRGALRKLFFLSMVSPSHQVTAPKTGDFRVDDAYLFEIGGKSKSPAQLKNEEYTYVVADDCEHGFGQRIPLWLFGFLY